MVDNGYNILLYATILSYCSAFYNMKILIVSALVLRCSVTVHSSHASAVAACLHLLSVRSHCPNQAVLLSWPGPVRTQVAANTMAVLAEVLRLQASG